MANAVPVVRFVPAQYSAGMYRMSPNKKKNSMFCRPMASISVHPLAARRLEGKVALITGGASGIGEHTAKLFIKHGARVVIADIQDDLGEAVYKELGPSLASYIHCDVTNEDDVRNAVDSTVTQYGKLDIMFNNAGAVDLHKPNILHNSMAEFEHVLRVNLVGPFLGTKHAARVMIPAQCGSIITTASVCTTIAGVASHAYTSSKNGVIGLMKNTAAELGKHGIRVNCMSPHVISTPMARGFYKMDHEGISKVHGHLKGALCEVDDAAHAALYLASDDSKYISGHNIIVDGGFTVKNSGFCMFDEAK